MRGPGHGARNPITGAQRSARAPSGLAGVALEHARGAIGVALATIEMLTDRGWRAVVGDSTGGATRSLGGDAVAERTEPFDPFAPLLEPTR